MPSSFSLQDEIKTLLKDEADGLSTQQIAEFFPDRPYNTISAAISTIYALGGYRRERVPGSLAYRYWCDPSVPPAPPREIKLRVPTATGLQARLDEATAKIAELEEWKADAIKRFPDLAVPPLVITAREIVAKRLKANGDPNGAHDVLAGRRDHTPLVQATVDALEWAA